MPAHRNNHVARRHQNMYASPWRIRPSYLPYLAAGKAAYDHWGQISPYVGRAMSAMVPYAKKAVTWASSGNRKRSYGVHSGGRKVSGSEYRKKMRYDNPKTPARTPPRRVPAPPPPDTRVQSVAPAGSVSTSSATGSGSGTGSGGGGRRAGTIAGATFAGKIVGRTHKVKQDKFARTGTIKHFESGGVTAASDVQYLGHSTSAGKQIFFGAVRSVIKELFRMYGQEIQSFDDVILSGSDLVQLSYTYYTSNIDTTVDQINVPITAAQTYATLADALATSIIATLVATDSNSLEKIWINEITGTSQTHASIRVTEFNVFWTVVSSITIQNRTLGGITTVDENDETTHAVDANPLTGKFYLAKGNFFDPSWRLSGDASYTGFTANQDVGWIKTTAADTIPQVLREPPKGSFFTNCTHAASVHLGPGEMKKHSMVWRSRMPFNDLFVKFNDATTQTGANPVLLGKSAMFGLEKQLDSRTTENPIALGWEINRTVKVGSSYSRKKILPTVPLLDVTTSAVA